MKKVVLLVAIVCLASVANAALKTKWHQLHDYNFDKYLKEYSKSYDPQEYAQRKQIFESRLEQIRKFNSDPTKTWKKGINHMSDWTEQEQKNLLGLKKGMLYASKAVRAEVPYPDVSVEDLPTTVDWRKAGVITAVKDQGRCGSCWSFGTSETVESHWSLKYPGKLTDLSEQQILDCTPNPQHCGGVGGCGGGTPELAYAQIMKMGGLSSEWTYPYISYFGQNYKCNNSFITPIAKLQNYVVLPSNQYAPVMNALAKIGPLAINIDASVWHDYEQGVFDGCNYNNVDIDHVVQLVGYGTDPQYGDYWLIRNSWGPLWAEQGYMRLKRNTTPKCGIDPQPSDGTGCDNGPATITACGTCGILYDVSYPVIA